MRDRIKQIFSLGKMEVFGNKVLSCKRDKRERVREEGKWDGGKRDDSEEGAEGGEKEKGVGPWKVRGERGLHLIPFNMQKELEYRATY